MAITRTRVTVTLPIDVINWIDEMAEDTTLSRSSQMTVLLKQLKKEDEKQKGEEK